MEAMFTKGLLKASNARQQEQEPLEELEELRYQCQDRNQPSKSSSQDAKCVAPFPRRCQQRRCYGTSEPSP